MTVDQIPALFVVVTAMLAPYGVVAALTHYFPTLAQPHRDFRACGRYYLEGSGTEEGAHDRLLA